MVGPEGEESPRVHEAEKDKAPGGDQDRTRQGPQECTFRTGTRPQQAHRLKPGRAQRGWLTQPRAPPNRLGPSRLGEGERGHAGSARRTRTAPDYLHSVEWPEPWPGPGRGSAVLPAEFRRDGGGSRGSSSSNRTHRGGDFRKQRAPAALASAPASRWGRDQG